MTLTNGHVVLFGILKSPNFNINLVPQTIRERMLAFALAVKSNPASIKEISYETTRDLILMVVYGISPAKLPIELRLAVAFMMEHYNITPSHLLHPTP